MRSLIVCNIMSLDGYYEGPGRDVMVFNMDETFDAYNVSGSRVRAPCSSVGSPTTGSALCCSATRSPTADWT